MEQYVFFKQLYHFNSFAMMQLINDSVNTAV